MDFFAHQERARKQSRRMLGLFTLAVFAIVVAVDLVVMGAWYYAGNAVADLRSIDPIVPVVTSLVVVLIIAVATLYRVATLRGGGRTIAVQFGATQVPADTTNFAWRRLRNVIEEVAIASGVPVPEIFVLEDEAAINAFVAGYTPADAAITVTRGSLDKLTRDELQGVIAHEFSHVLNGDMRLNIRLVGVAFGILVISIIGRRIAFAAGEGRARDTGAIVVFGLALAGIGAIGVFFARLIKASVSRQREFLADASAVQFTRQADGIAGALKKIGALAEGSTLASTDGEEVSHMLFGDGIGHTALFATHPPLRDRIKRLQPRFEPAEFARIAADWSQPRRVGEAGLAGVSISGFSPARGVAGEGGVECVATLPSALVPIAISAPRVAAQVGQPDHADYLAAAALNTAIPPLLAASATSRDGAIALVFALVLAHGEAQRAHQLAVIESRFDAGTAARTVELAAAARELHPMLRLPLAARAFPTLRRRPRPQLRAFVAALARLIDADARIRLDEYCLARLVGSQVIDALDPAATRAMGRLKLHEVAAELRDVLAIVAAHGHDDRDGAQRAYILGLHEVLPDAKPDYAPPVDWARALDRALPRLDRLAPAGKELTVRGLTEAISADGFVSVAEAELLRMICAALHCPLPPLLDRHAA